MLDLAMQLPPHVGRPVLLPVLFDYAATFIWALSGALIAARRGLVGMGVLTIAVVSATGGGLLRDGVFLPGAAPVVIQNPAYLLLALLAAALVIAAGRYIDRFKYLGASVHFIDALGAGTYAVVGVNRAIAADLPLIGIIIVGLVNATGGGVLRDVLMRRVPDLFKPGVPFGSAAMVGASLFALLVVQFEVRQQQAALVTVTATFLTNLFFLRLHIRSHPLEDFRDYWDETDRVSDPAEK